MQEVAALRHPAEGGRLLRHHLRRLPDRGLRRDAAHLLLPVRQRPEPVLRQVGLGLAAVRDGALDRPDGAHLGLRPPADPAEARGPHRARHRRLVRLDEAVQLRRDQLRQVPGDPRHSDAVQDQVPAVGQILERARHIRPHVYLDLLESDPRRGRRLLGRMGRYQGPGNAGGAYAIRADRDQHRSLAKSLRRRSGVPEEGAPGAHAVSTWPLRGDDVAAAAVGHHASVDNAVLSHHDREIPGRRGRGRYVVRDVSVVVQTAEDRPAGTRRRPLQVQRGKGESGGQRQGETQHVERYQSAEVHGNAD